MQTEARKQDAEEVPEDEELHEKRTGVRVTSEVIDLDLPEPGRDERLELAGRDKLEWVRLASSTDEQAQPHDGCSNQAGERAMINMLACGHLSALRLGLECS